MKHSPEFAAFSSLMTRVLSVPKTEILRREAEFPIHPAFVSRNEGAFAHPALTHPHPHSVALPAGCEFHCVATGAVAGGAEWPSVTCTTSPCTTRRPACGLCAVTIPDGRTAAGRVADGAVGAATDGAGVVRPFGAGFAADGAAVGNALSETATRCSPALAARALAAE